MLIKYIQLSRNIRNRREEVGLSEREIARATHIPLDTIIELETNKSRPTVEQLIALSLALDCTVDLLLKDVY